MVKWWHSKAATSVVDGNDKEATSVVDGHERTARRRPTRMQSMVRLLVCSGEAVG